MDLAPAPREASATGLEAVPFEVNSDDFVFDSQFLVQCVHLGFKIGDIPTPVRYFDEASSIDFGRATKYAFVTLWTFVLWYLHRTRAVRSPLFVAKGRDVLPRAE